MEYLLRLLSIATEIWHYIRKYKDTAYSKKGDQINYRLKKRESCKQKFKENRILTVTSLYVLEVLCFIKKYKGSLMQNYMIHEHNTRSKYDLHTEFCNTSLYQKSVINMGIRLYKFLPKEIKKLYNFNCLKKK